MEEDVRLSSMLKQLDSTLADFIEFFQGDLDYSSMVNAQWTARDVLGHIVFWHESFARVLAALVREEKPVLLKGRIPEINQQGYDATHENSIDQLVERLNLAQAIVVQHISDPRVKQIPYRKGSRTYTPIEHLQIVRDHIRSHMKRLRKHYR